MNVLKTLLQLARVLTNYAHNMFVDSYHYD